MKVYLDENAYMPTRAHETDAGLDLYARESAVIFPFFGKKFDTGVHVQIPEHCGGVLISKSGLNVIGNMTSTGLIDEGYTGSIVVKLINHGILPKRIKKGQKISQLVVIPVCKDDIELVQDLNAFGKTERGANGFGSTGK